MTGGSVGIRQLYADRGVRAMTGLALVVMTGFGLVLPVLPLYARSFGVGYGAASLMMSAFALTRLGADLVSGPLVDRYGEKRVGPLALCLTAACVFVAGLAPSFPVAVVFWAAGGVGSAAMFASFFSYLLRSVATEQMARTLALFYGSSNVGVIAGGPLGGAIAHRFGLGAPLLVYAFVLLAGAVVFARVVPEPPGRRVGPRAVRDEAGHAGASPLSPVGRSTLARLFRLPGFATVMLLNLAYMWMVGGVLNTLVPFFAKDALDLSTSAIGALFAVLLLAELAVLYPAGVASDRRGRKAVLVPSLLGLAVVTALTGLASTTAVFVLALLVLGVCSGFAGVPPAAMLSDVSPGEASGTAIGSFRFSGDLGFLLGPVVAGYTASALGFEAAFAIAAIPTALALAVVSRTPETLRRSTVCAPAT